MNRKSVWRQEPKTFAFSSLQGPVQTDVAIIGGGLTGLITAYLLKDSGLSVAVVEGDIIGSRGSGSTTAFLMELIDTPADKLIDLYGTERAKLILKSHRDAISFYEETSQKESIECEFKRVPIYHYARSKKDTADLEKEAKALQDLGLEAKWQASNLIPIKNEGYFSLPNQAKFHPLKFLYGLTQLVGKSGVHIYEHTIIKPEEIQSRYKLWATHYPPDPQPDSLFYKKAAYLTYVIEAEIPKNVLPEALFEDSDNPYHYLRVDHLADADRLILGGADHRMDIKFDEENAYKVLKTHLKKEILPDFPHTVTREWKGMIVESGDGLALLGPIDKPDEFYATGYSGNGLTYAVITAKLFRDWVLGKDNDLKEIYAADRPFDLRAHMEGARHYLGEFMGGLNKM